MRGQLVALGVSAVLVGGFLWLTRKWEKQVKLSGVTQVDTTLIDGQASRRVPKGIVVSITKQNSEGQSWVTIPASISDVLFDVKYDVSGWMPTRDIGEVVSRKE